MRRLLMYQTILDLWVREFHDVFTVNYWVASLVHIFIYFLDNQAWLLNHVIEAFLWHCCLLFLVLIWIFARWHPERGIFFWGHLIWSLIIISKRWLLNFFKSASLMGLGWHNKVLCIALSVWGGSNQTWEVPSVELLCCAQINLFVHLN